jgi:hypothetical protein
MTLFPRRPSLLENKDLSRFANPKQEMFRFQLQAQVCDKPYEGCAIWGGLFIEALSHHSKVLKEWP